MKKLKIDDGRQKVEITNKNGTKLGVLEFNPSDYNLPKRLEDGWNIIKGYLDDMQIKFANMGDSEVSTYANLLSDYDIKVKEQLDIIFDSDVSQMFKGTNFATPTTTGATLIENIMDGLLPYIEEEMDIATKNSTKHIEKYTKGYQK